MDSLSDADVVIIGGGAAGLMCAVFLGQAGQRVVVLDHANKVGKKILMSGGGRCNFTNLYVSPENYLSRNPHFCKSALSRYTQWDFIDLVTKHNISYHEKADGQLFCDNSSKDILAMLLKECDEAGVDIHTGCEITSVNKSSGFIVNTKQGKITSQQLVVATGGLSIPTMGATGLGYKLAEQFGHNVWPTRAGLVPFVLTGEQTEWVSSLSGSSIPISISCDGSSFSEQLLFTHRGLSGPAVLQISSYWQEGKTVCLDLMPSLDLSESLLLLKKETPSVQLLHCFTKHLNVVWPKSVALELLNQFHSEYMHKPLQSFGDDELISIAQQYQQWQLKPAGTEGYRTAEVTLGGVDVNELSSKSMESLKQDQLYFIGEVIDVTGHLGGFNFQWAWSSAFAAAEGIISSQSG